MSIGKHDLKGKAKDKVQQAARQYYNEGIAQSDAVLMKRLVVDPKEATVLLRKAAAFWFASQKMYLSSQKLMQSQRKELAIAYSKGALDLAHRSRRLLKDQQINTPVLDKIAQLLQRCKHEFDDESEDELTDFKMLVNPFGQDKDLKHFLESRQAIVQSKLQFLPDAKLVGLLNLEAQEGYTLDLECQQVLQKFLHLQTLFSSITQMQDADIVSVAFDVLERELKQCIVDHSLQHQHFLACGMFIAIHLLLLRVVEVRQHVTDDNRMSQYPQGVPRAQAIVEVCFKLGYSQYNTQNSIILTQASRAYFIGQALLLCVQYALTPLSVFIEAISQSIVDLPVIVALPASFRLLVTMEDSTSIAQVSLDRKSAHAIIAQWPFLLLKTFEVPNNRESLKFLELKAYHEALVKASSLEEVNTAAFLLFATLTELGVDWPDMYPTIAGIKSIFRRKNVKLVWHEDKPPFWTLKLRTALENPFQNTQLPKEVQICKLLKRFDF